MHIYERVLKKIIGTVGQLPAESGGIIAFDDFGDIVDFYYDKTAITYKAQYIPNKEAINHQVNEVWSRLGYRFAGIVHSHPLNASNKPSKQDILMAKRIIQHNNLDGIFLWIVQNEVIIPWWVTSDNQLFFCELDILK